MKKFSQWDYDTNLKQEYENMPTKKKVPAKSKSKSKKSKQAPMIKHSEYILMSRGDYSNQNVIKPPIENFLSDEIHAVSKAKDMLDDSSGTTTEILIFRLVKVVSTSQETKVEDIN